MKNKTRHVHGVSLDDSIFDFIKDIAKKESRSNSAQMEQDSIKWMLLLVESLREKWY